MNGLDDREFVEELTLNAKHDGESYKNADAAVEKAFKEFQKRRRREERDFFKELGPEIRRNVRTYWRRMRDEGRL